MQLHGWPTIRASCGLGREVQALAFQARHAGSIPAARSKMTVKLKWYKRPTHNRVTDRFESYGGHQTKRL